MSFTADVKTELSEIELLTDVQKKAYAYGFLIFGKSFNQRSVSCASDYRCVIESFCNVITELTGILPVVSELKSGKTVLKIASAADRKNLISFFDHSLNEIALRINHGNIEDDECYCAFLRGAFMSCGSLSDPQKGYHLEFVVQHNKLSGDLLKILTNFNLSAKYILRKYSHVIYIKGSENIEDLLTMMGAPNSSLQLMGIKVQKDVRNKINRKMNFEAANMSRAIEAGLAQVEAIEIIERKQGLDSLTDELKELAILRKENPDMSLKELGAALSVPISRSGVNHRLAKLVSIADKYR
ncbi:MAG: DNA-binding protein WhiA [Acutalibacteraceae bacterium]|nr:DNA-binding protein WhiA [Acutalibacteraceae bacterium]